MTSPPRAVDERRHEAGGPGWEERWELDLVTADGALGATYRLTLRPADGHAWLWCAVVGEGRRLVTVVEHEAPLTRERSLDLRCEGLWTDLVCEEPLEHWSVGLEAFGVALDEPAEALHGLRGDRVGVGLDIGWERVGEPWAVPGGAGAYVVHAEVAGEVLLGDEVLPVDGWGTWSHCWGPTEHRHPGVRAACGRLDDGTRWSAVDGSGMVSTEDRTLDAVLDDDGPAVDGGLPTTASADVDHLALDVEVAHLVPVPLPGDRASIVRALCRTATTDGRRGVAWWTTTAPG